jgi:dTDP-4-dehydrorhamnose reductase
MTHKILMQNSKILVFGKDGQIGKAFQQTLKNHSNITFIGRDECDLTDEFNIMSTLQKYEPQIILNAAAYTAVDLAEKEIEQSHLINAIAPRIMADYVAQTKLGQMVHFSTDYVFDGLQKTPYLESDMPLPMGQYGKSKRMGEIGIQNAFNKKFNTGSKYFILRTSWVYGEGGNFIKTILRLASEREELKVIADQFGVPSSAMWLSEIVDDLLTRDAASGIYHAVPDGETTWYGLATYAIQRAKEAGASVRVKSESIRAIPATDYPLPAQRPYNSRMCNQKLKDTLSVTTFPNWKDQVGEYVKTIIFN